jgi:hypothetical protein
MVRVIFLFLKTAAVAFVAACIVVGGFLWLFKPSRPGPTEAEHPAASSPPQADPPPQPKRSGAAKIVSAFQFAENVEASKRRAVQQYPELGVKDSAINREFIRRMRLFQSINPAFFEDEKWPEKLAALMATDLSLDPQKPAQDGVKPQPEPK